MDSRYSDWLRAVVPTESTWRTKLSELRRIETAYGDVDTLYDADELESLIGELTYTVESERLNLPNPSKLKIDGNIRNNLASYKSAAQKYARFRQELELEGARTASAVAVSASAEQDELERTFSMERDLQTALRLSISQLEPGLEIIDGGQEKNVSSGRIDILARDASGTTVVVELKAVKAPRDAVAQVLAYMGDIGLENGGAVRGMLVAPDFEARAISAARVVPSLRLIKYGFSFRFQPL